MRPPIVEANLVLYHSARSTIFDGIIWCLGPLADDTREYGWHRQVLAAVTRRVCRPIFAPQGES